MKLRFWKKHKPKDDEKHKPKDDDTIITVTTGPGSKQIYVAAKTSEKAINIYNKLKDEK